MEPRLSVEQAIGAAIFVLLIFVGLSSMLLPSEIEDMEREEEFYCEMVQLFKDSKGENGWPNFKNIDCSE